METTVEYVLMEAPDGTWFLMNISYRSLVTLDGEHTTIRVDAEE